MKLHILIISILFSGILNAQKTNISGYIYNKKNNETLPGAIVINKTTNQTVISNEYGYYSLTIDANRETEIEIHYVGFNEIKTKIKTNKKLVKNFYLTEGVELEAVYVTSSHLKNMSTYELSSQQIKLVPSLAGEKDVLKAFQTMPGVQFGSEGTSNLYVRGGSPDQNLILLDDIPVYYVSHLGSFVSVFDVNAIKNVRLYKGGFPARFGGRLSSVIDIKLKDGDMNKQQTEIFVGILSSKLSMTGPIIKNKFSYLFTLRRSNIDLVTKTFDLISTNPSKGGYTFYDANFKLTYKLSKNDNLHLFLYSGRDKQYIIMENETTDDASLNNNYKYSGNINNKWGNITTGFKWTHKFSNLYTTFNIGFTNFYYKTQRSANSLNITTNKLIEKSSSSFSDQLQSLFVKQNFDFYITNSLKINFGTYFFKHIIRPEELSYEYEEINVRKISIISKQQTQKPVETGAYIELSEKPLDFIDFSIGAHSSVFFADDTIFRTIQPRLKTNITVSNDMNFNFAYSDNVQFLHLLTISTSLVPADIWVAATKKAVPEKGNLFSGGITKKISSDKFTIAFDIFYKKISNLIDLIPIAEVDNISDDEDWQSQIATNGTGNIYGLEFLFTKNKGTTTGWLSYTYMKNYRKFQQINNGIEYPYYYDRRHFLTILINHKISDNISFSANFIFATGIPITATIQKQNIENIIYASSLVNATGNNYYLRFYFNDKKVNYTQLNNYRLPVYHRLDLNVDFKKQKSKYVRIWSLGLYNAYNHQNAYFIFFEKDRNNNLRLFKFTLFPIIPSISYSIKF